MIHSRPSHAAKICRRLVQLAAFATAASLSAAVYDSKRVEAGHSLPDHGHSLSDHAGSPFDHGDSASNHQRSASDHGDSASNHQRSASDHGPSLSNHQRSPSDHQRRPSKHQHSPSNQERPAGSREPPGGPTAPLFRITLLGTGNPRPSLERFGPASLVEAGDRKILIDVGRGTTMRLFQIGRREMLSGIEAVLLTHLHSDHVVGLPDLWLTGWLFGRERPLPVYGPEGTAAMMGGLERAFEFDVRTRRDVDERLPAAGIEARAKDVAPGIVFERNGLRVTAFAVDHGPVKPAYGYRIDFGGRSAVFSGDTRYSESLVEAARGTDLLVHEVVSPDVERRLAQVRDSARIERIIAHHTTPEEAGRVFAAVRPRLALYTHIVPSPATARDLVPPTRRTYKGPLEVGYDLMMITIGERIEVSKRVVIPDR